MKTVLMNNDFDGVVRVGKNTLVVRFSTGLEYEFRINTLDLLRHLVSKKNDDMETEKYLIEPMYKDLKGNILVIITVKFTKKEDEDDRATVIRSELISALKQVEPFWFKLFPLRKRRVFIGIKPQ